MLNSKIQIKFGACILIFAGGVLSVFPYIPHFLNLRKLFSPLSAFSLFSAQLFNYFFDKIQAPMSWPYLLLLCLSSGIPCAFFYWAWTEFLVKKISIPLASLGLYIAVVFSSFFYFYCFFLVSEYEPFFYYWMCGFNIAFSLVCAFLYYKNKIANADCYGIGFHFVLFFWMAWCAFPRFLNIVNV